MTDQRDPIESEREQASTDLARAIWEVVLLARDEHRARGLVGQVTRKKLVAQILELTRVVRRTR
jgi:hypothetical protein